MQNEPAQFLILHWSSAVCLHQNRLLSIVGDVSTK